MKETIMFIVNLWQSLMIYSLHLLHGGDRKKYFSSEHLGKLGGGLIHQEHCPRLKLSHELYFEGLSNFSPSVERLVQIRDDNPRI
jgi:hypothetical protein